MSGFIKRLLLFCIVPVLLLSFQYFVDPLDLYPGVQTIQPISGHYRAIKTYDFLHDEENPQDYDAVILGTSRVMRLRTEQLADYGYKGFNYGINTSRAEDYYCILRLLLDNNKQPIRLIIIGLEPEIISNTWPIHRQLLQVSELSCYLDNSLVLPSDTDSNLQDIANSIRLSFTAVTNSLKSDNRPTSHKYSFDPLTGDYLEIEPRNYQGAKMSAKYLDKWYAIYSGFTELHPGRLEYFRRFIELCRENNIEVRGYLTANHPILTDFLLQATEYSDRLAEAIAFWESLDYDGFTLVDYTSPEFYGGDMNDFADLAHIGTYNAELLLRDLMEQ
ncbi:hypothetical protein K8R78_04205 [bacterium]|nr:hypothetical protein [bacterium]